VKHDGFGRQEVGFRHQLLLAPGSNVAPLWRLHYLTLCGERENIACIKRKGSGFVRLLAGLGGYRSTISSREVRRNAPPGAAAWNIELMTADARHAERAAWRPRSAS
jgi:IS30 family transposase